MNTKLLAAAVIGVAAIAAVAVFALQRVQSPHQVVVAPAARTTPPADCLLPGPPPVAPNGVVASLADMKLGHDVMQNFVVELEAYQTCRNAQSDHAAPGVAQSQKDRWIEQGNEAIDEANALASSFGVQLKVFNARAPGK